MKEGWDGYKCEWNNSSCLCCDGCSLILLLIGHASAMPISPSAVHWHLKHSSDTTRALLLINFTTNEKCWAAAVQCSPRKTKLCHLSFRLWKPPLQQQGREWLSVGLNSRETHRLAIWIACCGQRNSTSFALQKFNGKFSLPENAWDILRDLSNVPFILYCLHPDVYFVSAILPADWVVFFRICSRFPLLLFCIRITIFKRSFEKKYENLCTLSNMAHFNTMHAQIKA